MWALPFLTVLCWSPKSHHKRRHKTSVDWVRQMIKQVRRWLPQQLLVLVVDGGFAAVALALACTASEVAMVSRMRLDAALYAPVAPRKPGQTGRPRKKGVRRPTLQQVLADPQVRHMQWVEDITLPNGVASKTVISPQRVSGQRLGVRRAPPALGAHTGEILSELKATS